MVFQHFNLFQNMTALANVMCGLIEVRGLKKREARERAIEFLDRVISADANYCYAYYQRAQIFESLGELESARLTYNDGIAAARRAGDAHAQSELENALAMIE